MKQIYLHVLNFIPLLSHGQRELMKWFRIHTGCLFLFCFFNWLFNIVLWLYTTKDNVRQNLQVKELSNQGKILYSYTTDIGLAVRVFANRPGDLGSIPGRVIPKTQKMVLDASLLNTQHYKVRIKGKVEQSREGVAPSLHLGVVAIEKGAFGSPSTMVANFTLLFLYHTHPRENF